MLPDPTTSESIVPELTHFVGGKRTAGTSGRFGDVHDPNTGRVQARVPLASRAEVEAVIADAAQAQPAWAAWNPQRRARVLLRFLQLVEQERDSLARLLSAEHGKTVADAHGDLQRGLEVVEFAAGIRTCSRASSPTTPAPASTCTRCASRSAWSASPRSTSRR